MNSLEEAKQSVIEDFSMYDEWLDKYEYLIDLGKNLEAYPESEDISLFTIALYGLPNIPLSIPQEQP